jgi:hypothetical protein
MKKHLFPYVIFASFCTLIVLNSKSDMWDSSIIEYGLFNDDLSGVKIMSFESGWIFQYYWVMLNKFISNVLVIKYKFANLILIISFGIIILSELKFIIIKIFNIEKELSNLGLLFFSTFPIWDIFLSSIMSYHFSFTALGFLSVRLIYSTVNKYLNALGWIILAISFNLNSLMLFLPTLGYVYDKKLSNQKALSLKTIVIFLIGLAEYIIYKICFPPSGVYKGYNKISLDPVLFIKSILLNITNFLPILITILLFCAVKKKYIFSLFQLVKKKEALYVLILIINSIFSYILVGRSHNFFNPSDWNGRQIIVLLPILTILYTILLSEFQKLEISKTIYFYIIPIILSCMLFTNIIYKLNRQVFEEDLVILLKRNIKQINSAKNIQIIGNIPGPIFRYYESNLLVYKVTGNIYHFTSISNTRISKMQYPYLSNFHKYSSYNIFKINGDFKSNEIIINIKSNGFSTLKDMILNTLGLNHFRSINIISTKVI